MPKRKRNPFVVVEALDAGGSQTQTDYLARRLKKEGKKPLQLHFPHEDRATGRLIYDKFLLNKKMGQHSRREQALLYILDFYSRNEDIGAVVDSKAKENVVVSDRYCTSTMAYQTIGLSGAKRQEMLAWIEWLCFKETPRLFKPDLVVFLDTTVDVSLQRLAKKKKDYFETKAKLTAIRNSYLRLAQEQKWLVFDSIAPDGIEKTRQALHQEIWQAVSEKVF